MPDLIVGNYSVDACRTTRPYKQGWYGRVFYKKSEVEICVTDTYNSYEEAYNAAVDKANAKHNLDMVRAEEDGKRALAKERHDKTNASLRAARLLREAQVFEGEDGVYFTSARAHLRIEARGVIAEAWQKYSTIKKS